VQHIVRGEVEAHGRGELHSGRIARPLRGRFSDSW
jgi:hypothetical protein